MILAAVEARRDITLDETVALLERNHGERFARSAVHRFFARRAITFKKRPRTPASRNGRTWRAAARPGSTASPTLIPSS